MDHKREAKKLLVHYFRLLMERQGMRWDSDYQVEIEAIVDHIVDAAVVEASELEAECHHEVSA